MSCWPQDSAEHVPPLTIPRSFSGRRYPAVQYDPVDRPRRAPNHPAVPHRPAD